MWFLIFLVMVGVTLAEIRLLGLLGEHVDWTGVLVVVLVTAVLGSAACRVPRRALVRECVRGRW